MNLTGGTFFAEFTLRLLKSKCEHCPVPQFEENREA